jgi:hypothetical protein
MEAVHQWTSTKLHAVIYQKTELFRIVEMASGTLVGDAVNKYYDSEDDINVY